MQYLLSKNHDSGGLEGAFFFNFSEFFAGGKEEKRVERRVGGRKGGKEGGKEGRKEGRREEREESEGFRFGRSSSGRIIASPTLRSQRLWRTGPSQLVIGQ